MRDSARRCSAPYHLPVDGRRPPSTNHPPSRPSAPNSTPIATPPVSPLGNRGWPAEADVSKAEEAVADAAKAVTAAADDAAAAVAVAADDAAAAVSAGAARASDAVADAAGALDSAVTDAASAVDDAIAAAAARAADAAADPAGTVQAAAADARSALEGATAAAREAASDVRAAWSAPPSKSPLADLPLTLVGKEGGAGGATKKGGGKPSIPDLKATLIASLAGLDRGAAASPAAVAAVEAAASALVDAAGGPVDLRWESPSSSPSSSTSSTMARLAGTWRLLYSSAFAKARRGAGARSGLGPARLGQIYQEISTVTGGELSNIVELVLPPPPIPPGLNLPGVAPVTVTATLRHSLEAGGGGPTVKITYEGTDVRADGGLGGLLGSLPSQTLPALPDFLRPSRAQRTSTWDALYLDEDLRISRGERGELRVHARVA